MAEPTIKQVETVHDLWQAFGRSQTTKRKLSNKDLRKGNVLLKESGGSGWSTMVQSILTAVVRCAEILYPANSDSLLEVAARLSQSSSSITRKDENRVTENTIMIMNASSEELHSGTCCSCNSGEGTSRSSHTIFEEGRGFPESEITSPYWLDICPVKGIFHWTFC